MAAFLKIIIGRGKTLIGILVMLAPHVARLMGKPVPAEADELFHWVGASVAGAGVVAKARRGIEAVRNEAAAFGAVVNIKKEGE